MVGPSFESPSTSAQISSDGIVMAHFKADQNVTLAHVKAQHQWLLDYFKGEPYYVLVEGGFGATFDPDVREWARSEDRAKYVAADAFVVKTLAHKLMMNFYLRYHQPNHPTKAFNSVEKAHAWLLEQRKMHQGG